MVIYRFILLASIACQGYAFGQSEFQLHSLKKGLTRVGEYSLEKNAIICGEHGSMPMKGVDLKTFKVFGKSGYALDKNQVYYPLTIECIETHEGGVCSCTEYIIKGANHKTFRVLGSDYAVDKNRVYFRGLPIAGADASTFSRIDLFPNLYFGKDKARVYWFNNVLDNARPDRFSIQKAGDNYILSDTILTWQFTPPDKPKLIIEK